QHLRWVELAENSRDVVTRGESARRRIGSTGLLHRRLPCERASTHGWRRRDAGIAGRCDGAGSSSQRYSKQCVRCEKTPTITLAARRIPARFKFLNDEGK